MRLATKTALAVLAVCAAPLVCAQWYVGGTVGSSNLGLKNSDAAFAGATSSSKSETDVGYKALVGYQFNTNFALEGGYVNLGKGTITNASATGGLRSEFKSDGWTLMAVGLLPMRNDFSLLGKVGVYGGTNKVDSISTGTGPGSGSFSKTESNLAYGIGLQYAINKAMSLRVEAESFVDLRPGDSFEKRNVNLYSVGLIYRF